MSEDLKQVKVPFSKHLSELKWRLQIVLAAFIVSSIASYMYADQIYRFLVMPLADAYTDARSHKLIFTGLSEAFFMYLRLSLFTGFLISFPVIAWQVYSFAAPGLYKQEKRTLLPYLLISPILFLFGAALSYFYVIPLAWKFFISFEQFGQALPIILEARVSEYLSLMISLIVGFGLAFQLPLVLILLTQLGVLEASWLSSYRRHAIVIIFIIAAVLTPPDVISQIALSLPLLLLYEISVLICKKIDKSKKLNNA